MSDSQSQLRRHQNLAARLQAGPMNALARMHDTLTVLQTNGVGSGDELSARLRELSGLTEWVIDDVNDAIRALSTDRFDDHRRQPGSNLFDRLKALCAAFMEETGIRCEFSIDADHVRFNSLAGEVLLRCVRELLKNTERHAHASAVFISSEIENNGSLVVEVEDDGIGLPVAGIVRPGNTETGFGLWNVDLCLRELGGDLLLHSDHGLTARVTLPASQLNP